MSNHVALRFKIGPAVIQIEAERHPEHEQRSTHAPFSHAGTERPSLTLRVRTDRPPPRGSGDLIGECATQWQLYAERERYRLEVLEQVRFQPKQVALINGPFDQADVYLLRFTERIPGPPHTGWFLAEVMTPFIQWWLTARLAHQAEGILVHGSATALRDRGLAFVGPSDAGKTTIVRWCRDTAQATVLNDEQIVIWCKDGRWQVGGTPWPGELYEVSPRTLPLTRLFVLKKAATNRFVPLSPAHVLRRIIPEVFLPIWTREGMQGLMESAARLVTKVPVGELEFVNDPSVAAFLAELVGVSTDAMSVHMQGAT